MGEESLVEDLLDEGARLLDAISADFSTAVWAFDDELSQWHLLIGVPRNSSRLSMYSLIQRKTKELSLSLDLNQIALVKDDDQALTELKNLLAHPSRFTGVQYEHGGKTFTRARPVLRSPRAYERHVLAAISRVVPDASMRHERESPRDSRVDAVIDLASFSVLVEIKAMSAPLSFNQLLNVIGLFTLARHELGEVPVGCLVVTPKGASTEAMRVAENLPSFAITVWNGQHDDLALRRSIEKLSQRPGLIWH